MLHTQPSIMPVTLNRWSAQTVSLDPGAFPFARGPDMLFKNVSRSIGGLSSDLFHTARRSDALTPGAGNESVALQLCAPDDLLTGSFSSNVKRTAPVPNDPDKTNRNVLQLQLIVSPDKSRIRRW